VRGVTLNEEDLKPWPSPAKRNRSWDDCTETPHLRLPQQVGRGNPEL